MHHVEAHAGLFSGMEAGGCHLRILPLLSSKVPVSPGREPLHLHFKAAAQGCPLALEPEGLIFLGPMVLGQLGDGSWLTTTYSVLHR